VICYRSHQRGLWGRPGGWFPGTFQGLANFQPLESHQSPSRLAAGMCCRIEKRWHVCLVMRRRQISECTKTRNRFRHTHRRSREPSKLKVAGTGGTQQDGTNDGAAACQSSPKLPNLEVGRLRLSTRPESERTTALGSGLHQKVWRIICRLKPTHTDLSHECLMSQLLWRSARAERTRLRCPYTVHPVLCYGYYVSDWLDVKSDKQQQKKEKILAGWRRQVCQYHIGRISEAKADTVQMYMTINSYFNSQRGSR
jgi:hypothetical protein